MIVNKRGGSALRRVAAVNLLTDGDVATNFKLHLMPQLILTAIQKLGITIYNTV
ncbi:MAG: hypothetical protein JEZ07_17920 [Phycisphaerae bacterium]|nr:hypothetical protein [Phycisphaerae bacterium]